MGLAMLLGPTRYSNIALLLCTETFPRLVSFARFSFSPKFSGKYTPSIYADNSLPASFPERSVQVSSGLWLRELEVGRGFVTGLEVGREAPGWPVAEISR